MSCVIYLIATTSGEPTEFDGKYVMDYDPTYVHPKGYDGGILAVTSDPAEAMQFPDMASAIDKYRESYGLREDGRPNRPLTAWTVCFERLREKGHEPLAKEANCES